MLIDISKQLKGFLKKIFIDNHLFSNNFRFSKTSQSFISNIIKLMLESQDIIKYTKIDTQHIENIPKGYDFNYIPKDISQTIENTENKCYLYSFELLKKKYQIAFIYPIKNKKVNYLKRLHKIISWLYIANHYASKSCSQKMNIYIYFTDFKKVLPTSEKTINRENANTAFTTSCQTVTEINLYREEEWFKVFIHETFHNLGLDFSEVDDKSSRNAILKIFPINSEVKLFETYCEIWAEIINILFISFDSIVENNSNTIENIIKKSEEMITYEILFSLFQSVKIINFMGLEYKDLYENSEKSKKSRDIKYKETANVFSYYILKSILFFKLNNFIEWCVIHNKSSLNFNKTNENILQFCNLIREHYTDIEYLNSIDKIQKWFKENNKCNYECKTLRMTLFENA
jgi:hypothetical protein